MPATALPGPSGAGSCAAEAGSGVAAARPPASISPKASAARSRNQGGVCMPGCAKGACGGSVVSVPMQTAGRWTTFQRSALTLNS